MKDQICIFDYMVSPETVGDWDGESERVADRVNMLTHLVYEKCPDDVDPEKLDTILNNIWDVWCQDDSILDAEEEELIDWVINTVSNIEFNQS